MTVTKLTLSADKVVIAEAKRLARERHTSVSAMFARFVAASGQRSTARTLAVGPLTRQASGLVRLPRNQTDRDLLEAALAEKYGAGK